MRSLIGLQSSASGCIRYQDEELSSVLPRVRRETGYLFQNPLYQLVERSVITDIMLGLRYQGLSAAEARQRAEPVLEQLNLRHLARRDPYTLSTGEQRRTVIAGLLAGGARTLLLDEPFTGLDYPGACDLIHHLIGLKKSGCTVVVCTHDLVKIIHHSDHCIVLSQGQLQYQGTAKGLIQKQQADPQGLQLEPVSRESTRIYP